MHRGKDRPAEILDYTKLAQYELLLKRDDCEEVITKTFKYELPIFKCLPTELERLNRCELALYAKKLLTEGGIIT